ncbi:putative GTP-binding protein 6 [Aplysia californica]|uniref:GTP-binding protein 6 n=1 Tax=Aplysia californica TaxID=6500 RepID=A0ABM0JXJ8_APLCA|nr:putative GTP-binding protein 6 [Aplysia californica]XP_035827093.1 putative GTP-binding protein 6 [Aplysia californica]XP_035827094.1 putative GTP-binding protein 6 [Aplysia californica]
MMMNTIRRKLIEGIICAAKHTRHCHRFICVNNATLRRTDPAFLRNGIFKWNVVRSVSCKSRTTQYHSPIKVCQQRLISSSNGVGDAESDGRGEEENFGRYVREICAIPGIGHRVMVIQPDIKAGAKRYVMTSRELKLEETCALVRTLPNWRVVEKRFVRTDQENTNQVFGSGNFATLLREIRGKGNISAVVIGIDRLKSAQLETLQRAWRIPVFDRYTVVLQIFKDHAQSSEAKLQVALAEIPYIRSRLDLIHCGLDGSGFGKFVGGGTPMPLDRRRELLQRRESKLKKDLEKLHGKRQELRKQRQENSVPTVAVVGYTNAGKTSLIKALTDDLSLKPQNQLFATLDVTSHEGCLASHMRVTFIDTVGFISDMPITLLDAFRATLEDAMMADVVLHIRDASHPDKKLQVVSVHKTLQRMLTSQQLSNMIEVYNKVDLLSEEELGELDSNILPVSAVTGQGFQELGMRLQTALMAATDRMEKVFRIPNSEVMLQWLYQEAAVKSVEPDPKDGQFLIVQVIISKRAYGIFRARFTQKKTKTSSV